MENNVLIDYIDSYLNPVFAFLESKNQALLFLELQVIQKSEDLQKLRKRLDDARFKLYRARNTKDDFFMAQVFRLLHKADSDNLVRMFRAFPVEVSIFIAWRDCQGGDDEFFEDFIYE